MYQNSFVYTNFNGTSLRILIQEYKIVPQGNSQQIKLYQKRFNESKKN